MYVQIQEQKRLGYSKQKAAEHIGCCWRTVDKYWDMGMKEYERLEGRVRKDLSLERYDPYILSWIRRYPDMSSAQIYDWLLERFDSIDASERTVRRHVARLRQDYGIPKKEDLRDYEAVPDLAPGRQMQVDFGESWMEDDCGRRIHVRFAGFILSYSRYRFVLFQSRPFTSRDLIEALRRAFDYFGGRTEEIVFDQDSVVSVSENAGDVVLTREMEVFRSQAGFEVFLCHGADPEAKGKIERTVQFVKGNFIKHRAYPGTDEALNREALLWLVRTGNAKPHGMTKEAPVSRFAAERALLIPCDIPSMKPKLDEREVRKDNTIIYRQNRYSLPLGTYNKMSTVQIEEREDILYIYTMADALVCCHPVSPGSGFLVQKSSHRHDRTTRTSRMRDSVIDLLGERATGFIDQMIEAHPRYECEQLSLIQHAYSKFGRDACLCAIEHCESIDSHRATDVHDWAEANLPKLLPASTAALPDEYAIAVAKRSVSEYTEVV